MDSSNSNTTGLERLRAAKKEHDEREEPIGVALGREWALNKATYYDVERVAALFGNSNSFDDSWTTQHALGTLVGAIGEGWYDGGNAEDLFGKTPPSLARVEGFIIGVFDVLEEVRKSQ